MFMIHHSLADWIPTITEKYLLKDLLPALSFQEQVRDSNLVHYSQSIALSYATANWRPAQWQFRIRISKVLEHNFQKKEGTEWE